VTPLVTIVIPCHGQARFLREAIESALDQSYPSVEVVVVDDAAPDGWLAASVADEFGVRFVRTPSTLGPGGARNAGIEASRGDYVLPLDADDLISCDYVARAVSVLEASPQAGVCYCKVQTFGGPAGWWEPAPGWSLRDLIAANRLHTASLYRRVCWEQARGYPPLALCEDWDFWIAVARNGWTFVRIAEYHVYKRQHERNLTHGLWYRFAYYCRLINQRHAVAARDGCIAFDVEVPHLSAGSVFDQGDA